MHTLRSPCALLAPALAACIAAPALGSLTFLSGPAIGTHVGNLVTNGSFENGAPPPGFANQLYWATGTANTPFAVPPGWSSSGASGTYALWGSDGIAGQGIIFSDVLPDGKAGMYFGNGTTGVSQTPTYHANGSVTFPSPPTFSPGYGAPSTLSQTINTPANPSPSYLLSFWVSGEDAGANASGPGLTWTEGVFGLKVTNVLPGDPITYYAVPSYLSSSPSRRLEFNFVPLNTSLPVTVEFINWGHFFDNGGPSSTELVLDDVIVNMVPAPGALAPLALASLVALRRRR